MIPDAVGRQASAVEAIAHAALTGDDPVRAFQAWIDQGLSQLIMSNGTWVLSYVRAAGDAALLRSNPMTLGMTADAGPEDEARDKDGKWTSGGSPADRVKNEFLANHKPAGTEIEFSSDTSLTGSGNSPTDKNLRINWIARGSAPKGTGAEAMTSLTKLADKHGVTLNLEIDQKGPQPDFLFSYYQKFGFERIKSSRYMRRRPKKATTDAAPSAPVDRVPQLQTIAVSELQGICDAVSQQAVRAFALGALKQAPVSKTAAAIKKVIDDVGVRRSNFLVSFIIVRTFSAQTIDAFRAAGITHVGTVAERARPVERPLLDGLVRDAKRKKAKARPRYRRKQSIRGVDPKDLWEVLTAGDNDVCPVCEDLSEEGPYTLDEAESLIPAHPNCRCALVPAHDKRYAPVRDEFDPNERRDSRGRWTAGSAGDVLPEARGGGYGFASRAALESDRRHLSSVFDPVTMGDPIVYATRPGPGHEGYMEITRGENGQVGRPYRISPGATIYPGHEHIEHGYTGQESLLAGLSSNSVGIVHRNNLIPHNEGIAPVTAPTDVDRAIAARRAARAAAHPPLPPADPVKKQKTKEDLDKLVMFHRDHPTSSDDIAEHLARADVSAEEFVKGMFPIGKALPRAQDDFNGHSFVETMIDENGDNIGKMERSINFQEMTAQHGYLNLNVTGTGLGKKILASQIALYQKLGLKKVTLEANIDVGAYAWAKYGFKPTEHSWMGLRADLNDKLMEKLGDISNEDYNGLKMLFNSKDTRAIWAIADSKYGKKLLLGEDWYGELDLKDKQVMNRFHAYIAKKPHG